MCSKNIESAHFIFNFMLFFSHKGFKGSTVGKASVMAMCGEKSGGVVQVHASF